MHIYNLYKWQHRHCFEQPDAQSERNTMRVILLTLSMMVIEIVTGLVFGSMALLADGWHMGTHAGALGIAAFAYRFARRNADNPDYSFGTGKVGVLGGFTSAVVLLMIALFMGFESVERILSPVSIQFNAAIGVAVLGLLVNVVSAFILQGGDHDHDGDHRMSDHHDHNLRAAYLHVIADAMTSVLAIIALTTGKYFGWVWMDPVMGIVGSLVIAKWSYGLLRDTSAILKDRVADKETIAAITSAIEADADNRVADIHVWVVGSHQMSAIISIVTHFPKEPQHYKKLLAGFRDLAHLTVEIHRSPDEPCIALQT
jgi:cation diffusion facilitator family transporter